jgi:hypothetical protein
MTPNETPIVFDFGLRSNMKPSAAKNWLGGSVAKTAQMFFGYLSSSDKSRRSYSIVLNRLLQLHLDEAVQIIYTDNSVQERRVIVYRFTSDQAYDQYCNELIRGTEDLEKGIWEPYRNDRQHNQWLTLFSDATPTTAF